MNIEGGELGIIILFTILFVCLVALFLFNSYANSLDDKKK